MNGALIFRSINDFWRTLGRGHSNPEAVARRHREWLNKKTEDAIIRSDQVDQAVKDIIARFRAESS